MTVPLDPPAPDRRDTLVAALWMAGAIASFTTMAIAGRAVSFSLDTFEIMLYRSALGLPAVLLVALLMGRADVARTRRIGLHAVRNLAHFAGQNLWFAAIALAPLAQVVAIEFTSPLWVLLLSALLLGERPGRSRIALAGVGFAGVLIVARPFSGLPEAGVVLAALAAVGFALTAVFTRSLTRTESTVTIMFWLTATQLVMALACAGIDGRIAWPSAEAWPWVALIAAAGLSAHACLTNALALAPAHTVMPIDFARLPIVAVAGAVIYGEALDPWVLGGGAVILGAAWANLRLGATGRHVAPQSPGT
jgi:drug/metabolite transporter (DMT)-like permease